MTQYLLGVAFFVLEIWLLKNTTYVEAKEEISSYRYRKYYKGEEKPLKIKIWWLITLILGNIGILWVATLSLFLCFWGYMLYRTDTVIEIEGGSYWRLHGASATRIRKFLNKEIW